MSAYLMNHQ